MKQQQEEEADEAVREIMKSKKNKMMMKSGLQGPRPAPLKICKDSHKIPVTQHRPPVIIYTRSPEVIHTQPQDFMKLVQRLTGSTTSNLNKSHRSKMKDHSNHDASARRSSSHNSQVALEPSTYSPDQNHQKFNSEDFSSHAYKDLIRPAEYTNTNDPSKNSSNISVSNNPDSNNFLHQILSPFGLYSPAFTLNPSLSPNSFPLCPSPAWVLRSSDNSPGYTFPLEYSPLFSNSPTDAASLEQYIFAPPHVRPPTGYSKDSSSDPFNRIP